MSVDARPTVDAPDDDPWLWLEEVEGERASAWVERQNARTLAAFGGPQVEADATTLAAILDRPDKIPFIGRRGPCFYNFWTDAAHPRGLWRRTTPESFRSDDARLGRAARPRRAGDGRGRGLDLGRRRARARQSTTARSCGCRAAAATPSCCANSTSARRRSWPDGFVLPEAKGSVDWIDDDTLLLSSAFGGDVTTLGLCPHGAAVAARHDAATRRRSCSRCRPTSMSACGEVDRTDPERPVWFYDAIGFFDVSRSGARRSRARPADRRADRHRSRLVRRPAAQRLDGRRQDLAGRLPARHPARRLPGRQPRLHAAVRARQAPRPARPLLERRTAGPVDPRQPAAGVRGPDAADDGWARHDADRPAVDRRGRRLAARCRTVGGQRRPAGQRAGSADAVLADAARPPARRRPC